MITQETIESTGKAQKSLTGGDSSYTVVQIRATSPGAIRVQWPNHEYTFEVSDALTTWLGKCQASRKSLAGTKAMYVPALARREQPTNDVKPVDVTKVRFQVPGPKLNREWGAVFVAYSPSTYEALGS